MTAAPLFVVVFSYMTFFQKDIPDLKDYLSNNTKIKRLWYSDYQNSYSIINYLLSTKTDTLFLLVDDYEVVYELGLFANKADFKRNKVKILSPNEQISIKDNNFYFSENVREEFLNNQNQDSILVTTELKNIDLDTKQYAKEVLTNDFLIKYSDRPNWIIWRKK